MDLLLVFLIIGLPLIASVGIRVSYNKNLRKNNHLGITGQEVARNILDKHGLQDIYVVATNGNLSDHYDPTRKVVRLSKDVYEKATISSMAIAAHECGHAIQHKEGYKPMKVRSAIVPVVQFGTSISYYIILIGFILGLANLIYIGIGFTALGLVFQIITLPVEFDASRRAEKELQNLHYVNTEEKNGVKAVLRSAAFTYIAGVLASALQVLRLLLIASRSDRR